MTSAEVLAGYVAAGFELRMFGGQVLARQADRAPLSTAQRAAIPRDELALSAALTGFCPLDDAIIRAEASRRPLAEIQARTARLVAAARSPDATMQEQAIAADWRRILRAAEADEALGVSPGVSAGEATHEAA